MSNPAFNVRDYIESNLYSAFGLVCLNNDELQVVKNEDARAYLKKYNFTLRANMFTTVASSALVGGAAAKLLPGRGVLRGVGVAYLAVVGAALGFKLGQISTQSSYGQLGNIMRRYNWLEDPKVLNYFDNKSE